jgi:hypothetical protein
MKNKKNIVLLAILLVLIVAAYFAFQKSKQKISIQVNEKEFTVSDTASITKIFISTKDGKNTLLERNGSEWLLNKKYKVRKELLDEILYTFNAIRIQKTVNANARNNVIKEIATQGIKVEIYIQDKLNKVFYIGGPTLDNIGTYFIMEGSEDPYVVHIPTFNGYLSSRFDLKETDIRSKMVFGSSSNSIKEIEITHFSNPNENLKLIDDVSVVNINGITEPDTATLNRIMNSFSNITLENFVDDKNNRLADSLSVITPTHEIKVTDMNAAFSNSIIIFENTDNVDRMFALLGTNKEVVTIQRGQFAPLLFKKSDFIRKKK